MAQTPYIVHPQYLCVYQRAGACSANYTLKHEVMQKYKIGHISNMSKISLLKSNQTVLK